MKTGPFIIAVCLPLLAVGLAKGEKVYNTAFCASVGGETEKKHYYTYPTGRSYVLADCETSDMREKRETPCPALQHAEGRHEVNLVGMNAGRLGNDAQHGICHIVWRQHLCPVQVSAAFVPQGSIDRAGNNRGDFYPC